MMPHTRQQHPGPVVIADDGHEWPAGALAAHDLLDSRLSSQPWEVDG